MKNKLVWGIALILAAGGLLIFMNRKTIAPAPKPQSPAATNTSSLEGSYLTGFEDEFYTIGYRIEYSPDLFTARPMASAPSTILLFERQNEAVHTIKIFYNGAAGFESSEQLWDGQYKSACPRCVKASSTSLIASSDIVTHKDSADTWIIFANPPGFVVADLKNPSDNALKVLATLSISMQITSDRPYDFTTVKTYFTNNKLKPINECDEVMPVTRTITRTQNVGMAALEMLLEGPNEYERQQGYSSSIPSGAYVKSLVIKDGTATADFTKKIEEGGGSCHMRMVTTQIRDTLLQFPTVKNVVLSVDGNTEGTFQP